MASDATVTREAHPAPFRDRASLRGLALVLLGVPLLWGLRLVVNYALASHSCFPGDLRRLHLPPGLGWVWWLQNGLNALGMLLAAAGAVFAYQAWTRTRDESRGDHWELVAVGEGRTRFLALWALLTCALFFVGVVFDFIGLWIVPICG